MAENPLELGYFDEALNLFKENIKENEDLYKQLHEQYNNQQAVGFSLGSSRTSVELAKVLSELRSNGIRGTAALFQAKRDLANLELRKKQQSLEAEKIDDSKDFVRATLEMIHETSGVLPKRDRQNVIAPSKESKPATLFFNGKPVAEEAVVLASEEEKEKIDKVIEAKVKSGEMSFTKNELAMKYDFNDSVEPVLEATSGNVKVVQKGTIKEVKDYPLARVNLGKIVKVDSANGVAYTSDSRKIRIVETTS